MLEKGMLTRDLGGEASTRRIGEAVVAELLA
jgi:isocitrate/isopropylmalate dehydrogenase